MMEISEIFENQIKIEPKVVSIETLFNNEDRINKTNYKPSYQRNYVWDDEKATYFIESIFLGTEIPPLIYFRNGDKVEVIDGRQRYETILRFVRNEFKLKKKGLQKLENTEIANKSFKSISGDKKNLFWDTKLRIIEFSFHTRKNIVDEMEEIVKKEIFKRYNSGITPLKPTDIDKAAYIPNDLNSYFKSKFKLDKVIYGDVSSLLYFEKSNIEIILKKVRQLLVLHQIPIKYYSIRKDSVVSRYFEFLSNNIDDNVIEILYDSFIAKINLLKKVKNLFSEKKVTHNRLIFECIFWAFSIVEAEKMTLVTVDDKVLNNLVGYIGEHIDVFKMQRSSFSQEIYTRFETIGKFFEREFGIDFTIYLETSQKFKSEHKALRDKKQDIVGFDALRINKPEPSSIAIVDICRQMARQRFLIRPPYQRNEVINKKKSSAIIESILLGIKLPPIFVFKRNDEISEVLDGQQRILSILGFLQEPYMDEENKKRLSDKNGFSLQLKNGILKGRHGKKFDQLSLEDKEKIRNFDLWIIEISEKNNQNFESIDLFIRLNNKPYPIKEDTFEMWNSYVSRDIIESVKAIHYKNKKWFYLRKNNSRMEDETIYTSLIYFTYKARKQGFSDDVISKVLDVYMTGNKINFRVKSKNEITKTLESAEEKEDFIVACYNFEFDFLFKLRELLSDPGDSTVNIVNKNLSNILGKENNKRTQQSFYALWLFLYDISYNALLTQKNAVRKRLQALFVLIDGVNSKKEFDQKVNAFRKEFSLMQSSPKIEGNLFKNGFVSLEDIGTLIQGYNLNQLEKFSALKSSRSFPFYKEINLESLNVSHDNSVLISLDDKDEVIQDLAESRNKLVIQRSSNFLNRLICGYWDERGVPGSDFFVFTSHRVGYQLKFLLSILSSRMGHHLVNSVNGNLVGQNVLNMASLKKLPIPILTQSSQQTLANVCDYIRYSNSNETQSGFYLRILDAAVYQYYFPEQFRLADCNILNHLTDFRNLESFSFDARISFANETFNITSNPDSIISADLLKILNIEEVINIEGKI